jgi:hypothetical protein
MSGDTEFQETKLAQGAGLIMVAVALLFLNRFADTVMGELATAIVGDDEAWRYRGLSTLWVIGGLLGSLGAAMQFRLESWRGSLSWSLRAGSVAAVLAVVAGNWSVLLIASFATGASAGWLLTALTTGLRSSVGTIKLGVIVGGGFALSVGLSEGVGLMAGKFGDPIKGGGIVVALLLAACSVLAPFLPPQEPSMAMEPEYRGRGLLLRALLLGSTVMGIHAVGTGGLAPPLWWWLALGLAPVLGLWLDLGRRRWPLWGAASLVSLGLLDVASPVLTDGLMLVARTLVTVSALYFAARGGRVWVAAGTMTVFAFIAPYAGSWLAG